MAILENMIIGKPIVATRIGGIPESVYHEKNGILVDAEPEAVAHAIKDLIINPHKMKILGENARKTVEEKFTGMKCAERFVDLYKKLVKSY